MDYPYSFKIGCCQLEDRVFIDQQNLMDIQIHIGKSEWDSMYGDVRGVGDVKRTTFA
jgi:hypothetical protein